MTSRPLAVRIGALGDMVLLTVAIRLLHARFGQPVDILGSGSWTAPLLHEQPGVGDIFLLQSRSRPYWLSSDQWRLVRRLRQRARGPTWLFDANNEKTRWLLQRAGWHDGDFASLTQLPDIARENFCDRWRRFAMLDAPEWASMQSAAQAHGVAYPQLQVDARLLTELMPWLQRHGIGDRRFILIQVGNKRTMRRGALQRPSNTKFWPEQRWAEVLRGLHALHPEYALLLLGVSREAALNERILALAGVGNAHNLAREMSVARLMALAKCAVGMISVDTGPAHVAAAVACPVLTLFDSETKRNMYAPRGPGQNAHCLTGQVGETPSLLGILPAQVLAAWRSMINGATVDAS